MADSFLGLDGLVAVVTGGAGHLGAAMAATLARHGALVVVADIDGPGATAQAAAIAASGGEAFAVEADVTSEESVAAAFAAVTERFGGLDVLVNNAVPDTARYDGPALTLSLEGWGIMVGGILGGALCCARQAIPHLRARGGGSIVNVASIHAHEGDPDYTAYSTGKAGLLGLTRALATQHGRQGIRCNSVSLGTIPPPTMTAEVRAFKVRHQLIGREGTPTDAASLVAFLASPVSGFITGADFVADGGVLAHLPSYADGGTNGPGGAAPRT